MALANCLVCNNAKALARAAASASSLARRLACSSLDISDAVFSGLGVGVSFTPACAPANPIKISLGKLLSFCNKVGITPIAPPVAFVTPAIAVAIFSIT